MHSPGKHQPCLRQFYARVDKSSLPARHKIFKKDIVKSVPAGNNLVPSLTKNTASRMRQGPRFFLFTVPAMCVSMLFNLTQF